MENKLELKHLAPYLPYGMKGQIEHPYIPYKGTWRLLGINENGLRIKNDDCFLTINTELFKPLLIPLSEFNNHIGGFRIEKSVKSNTITYTQMLTLLEGHYDVFGLLEAGLALNKLEHIKQ